MPFQALSPEVDETPLAGESPAALAERLALAKAHALARQFPQAIVIGADQVADVDGVAIGKPGNHERATAQLRAMSGRTIVFQTALAVVRAATGFAQVRRVPVSVRFRALTDDEIEFYLRTETPYDCAGSAKCETLAIALLDAIDSRRSDRASNRPAAGSSTSATAVPLGSSIRCAPTPPLSRPDPRHDARRHLRSHRAAAPRAQRPNRNAPAACSSMPNTLGPGRRRSAPLTDVLASGVIATASRLLHFKVVEDACPATRAPSSIASTRPRRARSPRRCRRRRSRNCRARPGPAAPSSRGSRRPRPRRIVTAPPPKPDVARASPWELLLAPALAGHDIGLLSEAGLPGVADPGALLVAAAHELGVPVVATPAAPARSRSPSPPAASTARSFVFPTATCRPTSTRAARNCASSRRPRSGCSRPRCSSRRPTATPSCSKRPSKCCSPRRAWPSAAA